ncbi:MAG: glycosyltransferase family 39 protein [Actinomycetota bacterium]|nr:glycosyltransferase family 39 protein [Actinomycetota bacterium]
MRENVRGIAEEYTGVILLFAALVAVKLLLVTKTACGPVVFMDEAQYTDYARSLAGSLSYDGTHYPLLYPLSISVAFFCGDNFHEVIKLLNVLYSSAIVVPAYLIARLTLERRESLACAGVLALIPFHLVLPRSVLSENLYFPLFLFAAWMVLRQPKSRPVLWDLGTGVLLGALYLTRYISFALIPVFVAVWWLRPSATDEGRRLFSPSAAKLGRFAVLVTAITVTFGVWIAMQAPQGASLKDILGFGIAARPDPAQLTLARLGLWVRVYGAYFVLAAAPVLGLVLMSVPETLRSRTLGVYERAVVLVFGLNAAFAVAMVRHSWRAYYNYPDPSKVMGRYAIYMVAFYIILAFMTLPRMRRWFQPLGATAVIVGWALPVALVLRAWRGLVESDLASLMTDRGAIDVYRMWLLGRPLLWVALILVTGMSVVLWRAPKHATLMLTAGLVVFYLFGVGAYYNRLMLHQVYARHGKEIAWVADELASPVSPVRVEFAPEVLGHKFVTPKLIARSASYWKLGCFEPSDGSMFRSSADAGLDELRLRLVEEGAAEDALVTYEVAGTWYSIIEAR